VYLGVFPVNNCVHFCWRIFRAVSRFTYFKRKNIDTQVLLLLKILIALSMPQL
jgi:hypothetical protein